jgi:RNA polymerase sigma factor (TIGR02999 family)
MEITELLQKWSAGDSDALERLMPLVYRELRRQARQMMSRERRGHTLQATALVHEVWMRLAAQRQVSFDDRTHFFGVAAKLMRRILVDHARRQQRWKRDPALAPGLGKMSSDPPDEEILALDEALTRLEEIDARKAQVVELKYFSGMNSEETAAFLRISTTTVERDWRMARAWLTQAMRGEGELASNTR